MLLLMLQDSTRREYQSIMNRLDYSEIMLSQFFASSLSVFLPAPALSQANSTGVMSFNNV